LAYCQARQAQCKIFKNNLGKIYGIAVSCLNLFWEQHGNPINLKNKFMTQQKITTSAINLPCNQMLYMTPKETITNYWQAWTEHNSDNLLDLLAPEFISKNYLGQGAAADKNMAAQEFKVFNKAFPDLKVEVINITAKDGGVRCDVMETATFTGFMKSPTGVIAPTNQSYKLFVASLFRINTQGLIIEQRTYWDMDSWAEQIGIDPRLLLQTSSNEQNFKRMRAKPFLLQKLGLNWAI
jgi:steroid delta-isomerase-like uncharacterized protein